MKIRLREALAFILLLFILSIVFFFSLSREEKKIIHARLVDNNTDYYDVSSIASDFVRKSNKSYQNELLEMLDKKYVIDNKITENNIFKRIKDLSDGTYSFDVKKMYYYNISNNLTNYYIYGEIIKASMDNFISGEDYYLVVTIDTKNSTFAITPDDGKIFKEVTNDI